MSVHYVYYPHYLHIYTWHTSTVVLLGKSITTAFIQKFAASRLLQKLYGQADKRGYGISYGQHPPFYTLPGFEDLSTEVATLGGTKKLYNLDKSSLI